MLSQLSFGALAAAGFANAIMIPPNVALESINRPAIPAMVTDPFSIKLFAPCQNCPYAEFNDKGLTWSKNRDSSFYMDIAVGKKLDTIELNGIQIFPPPSPSTLTIDPVTPRILQVLPSVSLTEVEKNPQDYLNHLLKVTGWGLQATTIHALQETGEEIIKVQLSINAIEGKSVDMPDIIITAMKNPEIKMMVLNVELQKSKDLKNCHGLPLLCKFKAMLGQVKQSLKTKMRGKCHKAPTPQHLSAAEQHKEEEVRKPHRRPHHGSGRKHHHKVHHHHHGYDKHQEVHRFLHKAARIILSVIVPLLLGVLAGMLTYTLGMLLGTIVALIWIRLRVRRSQYQAIALEDDEESGEPLEKGEFENDGFVEAPPMYIEVEAKEVTREG